MLTRTSLRSSAVGLLLAAAGLGSIASSQGGPYFSGEVQIRLAPTVSVKTINLRYGTATLDSLPPAYLLRLPDSGYEQQWVQALREDPDIEAVECSWHDETPEGVRQMVVIIVGGTIDGYLDQTFLDRLHIAEMQSRYSGASVRIALLDTGVRADHEALAGCIADDGWDFVDNDHDPSDVATGADEDADGQIDEGAGHGTMVAGILHLLAPDAQILPIRVLNDEGCGRVFDVAKGIDYAVAHGAKIINLSLGLLQHTFVIQDQILRANAAGVALVAAAGNLSSGEPPYYPALDPQVLSVAAVDSCDIKADFSNWHRSVDLSAPGVGILAPYFDGGYAIGAGTSFAAPFVAAQCAWIVEAAPMIPLADLYRLAGDGVSDIYSIPENAPYDNELGSGRIDGLATLESLRSASAESRLADAIHLTARPNPSLNGLPVRIRLASESHPSIARLIIRDVTGRIVAHLASDPSQPGSWEWRTERLPAGVYFAQSGSFPEADLRLILVR